MTLHAARDRFAAEPAVYDLLGIGFGPSNMALAIALDEAAAQARPGLACRFVERSPGFVWHGDMLLPGSDMQISFLKDLVSLRDPSSRFSFLGYLHAKGRLEDFINQKTFFPSRIEFNDYLTWAAGHFADRVAYGETVTAVEPERQGGQVTTLRVRSHDAAGREHLRRTRSLSIATGGRPNVPAVFAGLAEDARVFHSSRYLGTVGALALPDRRETRIAVVGAGQSAAEVFVDLAGRFDHAQVDLVTRSLALKPSDDTPFVNEIFNTGFTDLIYRQDPAWRGEFLREFHATNYAVVDGDLIEQVFGLLYQQKVRGDDRLGYLRGRTVDQATADRDGVRLTLAPMPPHLQGDAVETRAYDAVVLATGYRRTLPADLLSALVFDGEMPTVDRRYRLRTRPDVATPVFVQGCSEGTHGLSDTLLSVVSVRSAEIAETLLAALPERTPEPAEERAS